jgi:serine/threonine-protein kinase
MNGAQGPSGQGKVAQSVLGRYRLGEAIGAGGMGTVYRARDEVLGREVAVKLVREELASDERSQARFRQEARIAASLSHPGIAAVYDFAEEEGRSAIVMELLDGQDLHTLLQQEGPMEPAMVAEILAQAADALAYAHGLGAVHRDVKPANIFLTRSGTVKITDFGVAFAAGGGQLTTTGALIGTPDYLSPEQVRGERATAASDIYSLGCVAFQLLTGRPPFGGDNSIAIATARLDAPPPSARAQNPEVSEELDAVIRRSLAPSPEDRFANAGAMAKGLRAAAPSQAGALVGVPLAGPGTVSLMVGPPTMVEGVPGLSARVPTPPEGQPVPPGRPGRAPRRWGSLSWLWIALLLIFLVGLSTDIVRSWQRLNAPKPVGTWTNISYDQAAADAGRMGFRVVKQDVSSPEPAGKVLAQDPKAGVKLKRGLTVSFSVSLGNQATVPDVTSKSVNDAVAALKNAGFSNVNVSNQPVPGTVDNQVASQQPTANSVVDKATTVTLVPTAAVQPDQTPSDSQSLLCSLFNTGCSPTPTPTPKHKSHG